MTDILDEMDKAAAALLHRASGKGLKEGEKQPSLAEQVKAFEAVGSWAETRNKIKPPEATTPKESKFEQLRGDFHGRKAARSRGGTPATPHLVPVPTSDTGDQPATANDGTAAD